MYRTAIVLKVIDGDTISLDYLGIPIRCRIANIDTPEKGKPHFQESKDFLTNLLEQKEVNFELTNPQRPTDARGRYVINATTTDNKPIDEILVENGQAWHWQKFSNKPLLEDLQASARTSQIGIWNPQFIELHYCYKCVDKKPQAL